LRFAEFFIPNVASDEAETRLAEFAAWCGCPVPPQDRRVQHIAWTHDGEQWEAMVGRPLRGSETRMRQRNYRRVEVTTRLSDPATVLAILPGNPYFVVTDARPIGHVISRWANPFMAGVPSRVEYFDLSSA